MKSTALRPTPRTHVRPTPPAAGAGRRPPATAAALAALCIVLGGCATTSELGRVERLPEGTLPPSKEVGPAVNIQPAPLAREGYRPPIAPGPWGYRGAVPFGFYSRGCFDPLFCRPGWGFPGFPSGFHGHSRGRSGIGLQFRLF